MKILILLLLPVLSYSQIQRADTTQITVAGLDAFKSTRTTGKALQILGSVALGTYFFLEKGYETKVEEGDLTAKRPTKAIPILGCAVMAIGFTIDMGAIDHLVKKKKRKR